MGEPGAVVDAGHRMVVMELMEVRTSSAARAPVVQHLNSAFQNSFGPVGETAAHAP